MTLDADGDGNLVMRPDGKGGVVVLVMKDGTVRRFRECDGKIEEMTDFIRPLPAEAPR